MVNKDNGNNKVTIAKVGQKLTDFEKKIEQTNTPKFTGPAYW